MAHCGAKTRSGTPCKRHATEGAKRCRLHGGTNPGPPVGSANAASPGSLYSKFFSPEERAAAEAIKLGSVDGELRLTRIRLTRALAREHERGDTLELESSVDRDGGGPNVAAHEEARKVRDYCALIDKLTARIESLEKTRKALVSDDDQGEHVVTGFETVEYDD